jgi:hypothetical protein
VLTLPFPLRFPLALDGKLLGQVLRIFADTVTRWYRKRHAGRGLPSGDTSAVTVIQRANSDLRVNPHFHTLFLDGVSPPAVYSGPASRRMAIAPSRARRRAGGLGDRDECRSAADRGAIPDRCRRNDGSSGLTPSAFGLSWCVAPTVPFWRAHDN